MSESYENIKKNIEYFATNNYEAFVKAIISYEKGIDNENALNVIYKEYIESDSMLLLNDEFDSIIHNLERQGLIKYDKYRVNELLEQEILERD